MGIDAASKQLIAWHIATAFGLGVYYLPLDLIPEGIPDLDNLARLWQREALLLPCEQQACGDAYSSRLQHCPFALFQGSALNQIQWP